MKMTKLTRYALLAVCAAAMLALTGCLFISAIPTGVIEGHVTDFGAGEPVIGSTVTAWPESGEPIYLVRSQHFSPVDITDSLGHYRLTVPEGIYTVQVEREGHATSIVHGVHVGSTVRIDVIQKPVFHPAWSLEPPEVTLTGVDDGDSFAAPIDFRVDVTGDNSINLIYVALGKTPGSGWLTAPRLVYSSVYTTGDDTIDPTVFGVEGWTTFEVVVYDQNNNRTHIIRRIHIEPAVGPETIAPPVDLAVLAVTLGDKVEFFGGPIIVPTGAGDIEIHTAPAGGNLYVQLDWTLSPDDALISGYRIYRKLDGEAVFTRIGSVAPGTTRFRDSSPGLQAGLEVTYRVLAFSGATESSPIEAATTPLDRWDVRLLTPADGADGVALHPTFSWEPSQIVAPYKRYIWVLWDLAHGTGRLIFTELLNETTYQFTGMPGRYERLQPHRIYQWYIGEAFAYDDFYNPTAISIAVNDIRWITGNPHLTLREADLFTFTTGDWPY